MKLYAWMTRFSFCLLAAFALLTFTTPAPAQTTVSTGSIQGTVTDPSGAVVSGAKVTITNKDTGQVIRTTSGSSGLYTSPGLVPGSYLVRTEASGFKSVELPVVVQVGVTTNGNVQLAVGQSSETIEVEGATVGVNTEQAEVQGVLSAPQIENLPVNGRNFLDLAQLEPGVQIQDGQNFDPTKAGYSSISFGGRFGRTARISVDGVDVSDETVGTTTADIPASAIAEFQLAQSSLDLSNDLTSSGAVNVTTKSGTNTYHGQAFGFIRDHSFAAHAPGGVDQYMQRDQYGGRFGGAIIKDKLFFFADGERTKQDSNASVLLSGTPYAPLTGAFTQPFRENNLLGRVDYNLHNGKLFYRYSYYNSSLFATFGLGYSVYDTKNYTRQHVVGWDFNTGSTMTHSVRFSYLKFQNGIVDATLSNHALPDCCTGLMLTSLPLSLGPNLLAPQATPQSDHQIKYDGTKIFHSHTIRFGISYNHLQGGGFADFYGIAPRVSWTTSGGVGGTEAFAASGPFPGGASNPLNYPVNRLRVGNGQGFNTTNPAFGFPAGGLGPDNRLGIYIGDNWKVKPNLTVSAGVRYDRDTGRTDSDLPAIPEINAAFPGWGNPVKQANLNFGPQLGLAWDPTKSGKTVIRAGIGMYYENVIWNNVLFDRPERLRSGAFNAVTSACLGGVAEPVPVQGGTITPPAGICGNNVAVGTVIPQIMSFWQQVLSGNPFNVSTPNPNFVGTSLSEGLGVPGPALFAPNYKSPVSLQMNAGIQHQIRNGMVFSADYLRNVETRSLLAIDVNKVGDISTFNLAGAQSAIAATNGAFGCPANFASSSIDCAILAGATIGDYAGNGLAVPNDATGAGCAQPVANGGLGYPCAFGGVNPMQNQAFFLEPIGRSVYNALQVKLTQNINNPFRGAKSMNFQVSYSLSRFDNDGGSQATGTVGDSDQDFVIQAMDNNKPGRYFGPSLLDRTHQLSFGGYVDVPAGFRVEMISHFYSPLSSGLISPDFGNAGEIFMTDFTGDGTVADPIPGSHLGEFDRGVNASNINKTIAAYNANVANTATPAGQVLINRGLMTLSQLQSLGAVAPHICLAPPAVDNDPSCSPNSAGNQQDFPWLRAFDFRLAWRHSFIQERLTIEPSVGIYNLFNFANFNLPPNTMNGLLTGAGSGAINGTTRTDLEAFRVGNGTGVYSLGSQRQIEFGLKLDF